MRSLFHLIFLLIIGGLSACSVLPGKEPADLMMPSTTFQTVKARLNSNEKISASLEQLEQRNHQFRENRADSTPFKLDPGATFDYGWCEPKPRPNTLKKLADKLQEESAGYRDLAHYYLFTGHTESLRLASQGLLDWVHQSDLFNAYQLGMDTEQNWFPGIEEGFCNRSWNMMLDSMWQGYGLLNFSQLYWILDHEKQSSKVISEAEQKEIRTWLKYSLVPAVNGGFHAWTRWADAHPQSSAYQRYRSDNHLPWSQVGLAAAGFALGDTQLVNYVYQGGSYDDGYSGVYQNPSPLGQVITKSIKADGEVYDEKIRDPENKGFAYAMFSLIPQTMMAHLAETHLNDKSWWTFKGPSGGSILDGLRHYAPWVAGERPLTNPLEKTSPSFYRFIYRILLSKSWLSDADREIFIRAARMDLPAQVFIQGLGEIELLFPVYDEQ
ncbi:MAG: alginate lyase family protein [Oceanobacter sp.]